MLKKLKQLKQTLCQILSHRKTPTDEPTPQEPTPQEPTPQELALQELALQELAKPVHSRQVKRPQTPSYPNLIDYPTEATPHWRRIQEVFDILDSLNTEVLTYSQIAEKVHYQTGKSCSRKLIAKWKRQRGIIQ
jgi:hypothetical protein